MYTQEASETRFSRQVDAQRTVQTEDDKIEVGIGEE